MMGEARDFSAVPVGHDWLQPQAEKNGLSNQLPALRSCIVMKSKRPPHAFQTKVATYTRTRERCKDTKRRSTSRYKERDTHVTLRRVFGSVRPAFARCPLTRTSGGITLAPPVSPPPPLLPPALLGLLRSLTAGWPLQSRPGCCRGRRWCSTCAGCTRHQTYKRNGGERRVGRAAVRRSRRAARCGVRLTRGRPGSTAGSPGPGSRCPAGTCSCPCRRLRTARSRPAPASCPLR